MIFLRKMFIVFAAVLIGSCFGCDARPTNDDAEPAAAPSPWRDGAVVAVPPDETNDELEKAIARARETAEEARTRWARTGEALRTRWAVKWAAPTADGGVEYLWIQPLHWSAFRIEGLLASEPVKELAAHERRNDQQGVALGDMVAFPIEELADWVHYVEGDPAGPREGGFTIDVLEARYGRPQ